MNKTKCYILGGIFLCFVVGVAMVSIKPTKAETTTTFPVGEAGIAAYVKLDSVDAAILTKVGDTVKKQGESYVIVTVNVPGSIYPPHVYIGLDGWIVAYYLKEEEASRIMQWKDYTPGTINTTTLKDAINIISEQTGTSYSTPIKYYHFEFPEANKMTLIADQMSYSSNWQTESFYVTVPGTLYEASYTIEGMPYATGWCWYVKTCDVTLKVDDITVFEESSKVFFGDFDISTYFKPNIIHNITYTGRCCEIKYATVLIYKN